MYINYERSTNLETFHFTTGSSFGDSSGEGRTRSPNLRVTDLKFSPLSYSDSTCVKSYDLTIAQSATID